MNVYFFIYNLVYMCKKSKDGLAAYEKGESILMKHRCDLL